MSGFYAIATMRTDRVTEDGFFDLLSAREHECCLSIANGDRRKRWIGGRLLAKHLFLTLMGVGEIKRSQPKLRRVDLAELSEFPDWAYREVEILPRHERSRVPSLVWAGRAHPLRISLAHASGLSAAGFGHGETIGIDIESPCKRTAAFYRTNFSPSERRWAETLSRYGEVDVDRGYTLLWCLKESALKSFRSDETSLWLLPRIEVKLECPLEPLAEVLGSSGLTHSVLVTEAEVRKGGQRLAAEAALSATSEAILTSLRLR